MRDFGLGEQYSVHYDVCLQAAGHHVTCGVAGSAFKGVHSWLAKEVTNCGMGALRMGRQGNADRMRVEQGAVLSQLHGKAMPECTAEAVAAIGQCGTCSNHEGEGIVLMAKEGSEHLGRRFGCSGTQPREDAAPSNCAVTSTAGGGCK